MTKFFVAIGPIRLFFRKNVRLERHSLGKAKSESQIQTLVSKFKSYVNKISRHCNKNYYFIFKKIYIDNIIHFENKKRDEKNAMKS